jgi:DNA-binding IclR family transcriptional regulator
MSDGYTNDAQQRLLRLILVMFGDVVRGFAPSSLSKALECTPSCTTRDLANLKLQGLAEVDDQGMWRLTPRLIQQSLKAMASIEQAAQQLESARNKYTRTN